MAYQLGVDLGTTFTAAAVARDGRAEPVTLGTNSTTVPSVVVVGDDGTLVIGNAAQLRGLTDPSRVAREFKRRVGDPVPLVLAGHPVGAEVLMAGVLDRVVTDVVTAEGERPTHLVVTHPANWGSYKLGLLRRAVGAFRLEVDGLVPEPVAATTYYAAERHFPPGTAVAVYDLGGGTFDAAVVRSGPAGFEVVGRPDGIERLGGIDFDHAVLRHVAHAAGIDLDALAPDDHPAITSALTQLRRECVAAKEALSTETELAVPVTLPDRYTEVQLTRATFEAMIRPALDETIVALRRAVASAGLAPEDLSAVLLVGGSSRIPLVGRLVAAELGRPIAVDARPKDAVCLGAALTAAQHAAARTIDLRPTADGSVDSGPRAAPPDSGPVASGPPAAPRHAPVPPHPRRRLLAAAVGASVVALAGAFALQRQAGSGPDTGTAGAAPPVAGAGAADVDPGGDGGDDPDDPTAFVSAGADHSCALETGQDSAAGAVTCWGNDDRGQASPPAEPLVAVDAGVGLTCGIGAADTVESVFHPPAGTVMCWGNDDQGATSPPVVENFERFFEVSAGGGHACAVAPARPEELDDPNPNERVPPTEPAPEEVPDGLVRPGPAFCWGNNDHGQAATPDFATFHEDRVEINNNFVSVSAGGLHTCGLHANGLPACWGNDDHGQASPPEVETEPGNGLPPDIWSRISAGRDHTCMIRAPEGFVDCWGNDASGQASPPEEQLLEISAGTAFTCGIRTDNTVTCWGDPKVGDVPDGEFTSISAGDSHVCGARTDDSIVCWGSGPAASGPP